MTTKSQIHKGIDDGNENEDSDLAGRDEKQGIMVYVKNDIQFLLRSSCTKLQRINQILKEYNVEQDVMSFLYVNLRYMSISKHMYIIFHFIRKYVKNKIVTEKQLETYSPNSEMQFNFKSQGVILVYHHL